MTAPKTEGQFPYTVVTAWHPDINRELEGEVLTHYTSVVTAANGREAAAKAVKEHLKESKKNYEFKDWLKSEGEHNFNPGPIIVLVVFRGHPIIECFGWAAGIQPPAKGKKRGH